jgi:predicted nuclease with TOPRIM domain
MENSETENERNHAIDVALKQCDEIAELRRWKIDKNNELAVLRVENVEQQDKIKSLESEKEALQKRVQELEGALKLLIEKAAPQTHSMDIEKACIVLNNQTHKNGDEPLKPIRTDYFRKHLQQRLFVFVGQPDYVLIRRYSR